MIPPAFSPGFVEHCEVLFCSAQVRDRGERREVVALNADIVPKPCGGVIRGVVEGVVGEHTAC